MELKDTVKGMISSDYKERMAAEYHQVKIRHDKLEAFCDKIEAAQITGEKPPEARLPPLHAAGPAARHGGISSRSAAACRY